MWWYPFWMVLPEFFLLFLPLYLYIHKDWKKERKTERKKERRKEGKKEGKKERNKERSTARTCRAPGFSISLFHVPWPEVAWESCVSSSRSPQENKQGKTASAHITSFYIKKTVVPLQTSHRSRGLVRNVHPRIVASEGFMSSLYQEIQQSSSCAHVHSSSSDGDACTTCQTEAHHFAVLPVQGAPNTYHVHQHSMNLECFGECALLAFSTSPMSSWSWHFWILLNWYVAHGCILSPNECFWQQHLLIFTATNQ